MDEKTHILFVINPVSGDKDKDELREEIELYIEEKDYKAEFMETTGESDREKLFSMIDEFAPQIVVSIGGDGTANLVAAVLRKRNIRMGIMPAGSANGMAAELSIPGNTREALDVIFRGKSILADIIRINEDHYSLHLSDLGFNAKIVEDFEKESRRGFFTYARMFFNELLKFRSHRYIVRSAEGEIKVNAMMIAIANSTKYATGAVINPKGSPDDGKFEVVVIKPYRALQFVRMIIPFYTGKIHRLDFVNSYAGSQFTILNPDLQTLQVDGEIVGKPAKVHARIEEGAVELLVP